MRTLTISLSKVNSFRSDVHNNFSIISIDNLHYLAELTCRHTWSPCRWIDGRRCGLQYAGCDIGVLDFDGGTPLVSVADRCRGMGIEHIITTTKSHQQPKKSGGRILPPADRFRLILPLNAPLVAEPVRYKWQLKWLQRQFRGSDPACCDAARYYFPGASVAAIAEGRLTVIPTPPTVEAINSEFRQADDQARERFAAGVIAPWVQNFIKFGVERGCRRKKVFSVAAHLSRLAMPHDTIERYILSSPFDKSDLDIEDIRRQISNGIKAGRKTDQGQRQKGR